MIHPEVRTVPSCVASDAELEPPVRASPIAYAGTLHLIAHHDRRLYRIIRDAVAGASQAHPWRRRRASFRLGRKTVRPPL